MVAKIAAMLRDQTREEIVLASLNGQNGTNHHLQSLAVC